MGFILKKKMLVFFGAPGVGKGTQAKIICNRLHLPHISTGDILREAIRKKTTLGLLAKEIMDKGELVSDEIMIGLVETVLKDKKSRKGFILDGFPRTLHQAQILQPIIEEISDEQLVLINLDADDDLIVNRLAQRRMCSICQSIVNLNFLKDAIHCPTCGSENSFIKRKDDEVEVIKNRINIFYETTKPVLDYYKDHAIIINIDGTLSVDEITKKILDALN